MYWIFSSVLSLLVPVFVIGAIVYLILHWRNGNNSITAQHALITYFHIVIGASVITVAVGLGYLAFSIFSQISNGGEVANEVATGLTLLGTGSFICISHILGRQLVEKNADKVSITLKRIHLFLMLAFFSIAGLIALPLSISITASYYIDESMYRDEPWAQLATAIVVVPLWIYYLVQVLRETQAIQHEEVS